MFDPSCHEQCVFSCWKWNSGRYNGVGDDHLFKWMETGLEGKEYVLSQWDCKRLFVIMKGFIKV